MPEENVAPVTPEPGVSKAPANKFLSKLDKLVPKSKLVIFIVLFAIVGVVLILNSFASTGFILNSSNIVASQSSPVCTVSPGSACYTTPTETGSSKKNSKVIQLAAGTNTAPSKVAVSGGTFTKGVWEICLVAKSLGTTATGSVQVFNYNNAPVGSALGSILFSVTDATKYNSVGCIENVNFDGTSPSLMVTVSNNGPAVRVGSIVVNRIGDLPPPPPPPGNTAPTAPPIGTRLCNNGADAATYLASKHQTLPTVAQVNADPEFSGYAITSVVNVPAGDNSGLIGADYLINPHTFYWFAPGIHFVGQFNLDQETRVNHVIFYGGGTATNPAIVDGSAFGHAGQVIPITSGQTSFVMFEYLKFQNYTDNHDSYGINHDGGRNWTIKYDTLGPNPDNGAAVGGGDNEVIEYNCFTQNGQYGINGADANHNCYDLNGNPTTAVPGGGCHANNMIVDHNEFDTNNYHTFTSGPSTNITQNGWSTGASGAGCPHCGYDNYPTPGGPLASNDNYNNGFSAAIHPWEDANMKITNNWIHDTHAAGIWADTDNIGTVISGNYITNSWAEGIMIEVSYNTQITNNTLIHNNWVKGTRNGGFPNGAVYMSESGYNSKVTPNNGSGFSAISGNVFTDNENGVILWEAQDRYCTHGNPTTECTEPISGLSPQPNFTSCASLPTADPNTLLSSQGLLYTCRWNTANNHVTNNVFNYTVANVNPGALTPYYNRSNTCTNGAECGLNTTISNGGDPHWPSDIVSHSVTWDQSNIYDFNTYSGPWHFDTNEPGISGGGGFLPFSTWQKTVGSHLGSQVNTENHPAQDVHSTCTNGCT